MSSRNLHLRASLWAMASVRLWLSVTASPLVPGLPNVFSNLPIVPSIPGIPLSREVLPNAALPGLPTAKSPGSNVHVPLPSDVGIVNIHLEVHLPSLNTPFPSAVGLDDSNLPHLPDGLPTKPLGFKLSLALNENTFIHPLSINLPHVHPPAITAGPNPLHARGGKLAKRDNSYYGAWSSLGCYTDIAGLRILPQSMENFGKYTVASANWQYCQSACQEYFYTLCGLEYGVFISSFTYIL
jgi:hypothetical protein